MIKAKPTHFQAIRNLTLIKPDSDDEFHGKIFVPQAARANVKPATGIVISVGPESPVKKGDRVMYAGSQAQVIQLDGQDHHLAAPDLIAGVLS